MKNEKVKVYLYTRVSTLMQIDGYSLDAQKTKMERNRIVHFQSKKPTVCDINFYLFDCLSHTPYTIKILNEWNLYKDNRINTWTTII